MLEKNNGITLVSLVVTIIVLLILAGITVVALWGENGVINRAELASKAYELSSIKESLQLEFANLYTEYIINGTELTKTKVKEVIQKHKGELQDDNETIKIEGKGELHLSELYEGKIDFTK